MFWRFVPELFETTDWEQALADEGIAASSNSLEQAWKQELAGILSDAGLSMPEKNARQFGSRHDGHHSEHLGLMLCEMQFLQRAYPTTAGAAW